MNSVFTRKRKVKVIQSKYKIFASEILAEYKCREICKRQNREINDVS